MTDYPYDPELPFVIALFQSNKVVARFLSEAPAKEIQEIHWPNYGQVIDTTPAPKIPADAEFIYWVTSSDAQYYARRLGHPNNKVWLQDSGRNYDEDDLIEAIGEAEVVVLKRA